MTHHCFSLTTFWPLRIICNWFASRNFEGFIVWLFYFPQISLELRQKCLLSGENFTGKKFTECFWTSDLEWMRNWAWHGIAKKGQKAETWKSYYLITIKYTKPKRKKCQCHEKVSVQRTWMKLPSKKKNPAKFY